MRSTRIALALGIALLVWVAIAGLALDAARPMAFDQEPLRPEGQARPDKPGKPPKPPKPEPSNKWAVVIGIADYRGRDNDLWHPDEDAKEMASVLEEKYGYTNIMLLTNKKATASAILGAIDWLVANTDEDSQAVFFFSGHGYRSADSNGWDSDLEEDGFDEMIVTHDLYGLPDGMLASRFADIPTDHFTLFFGSCHSGGMFDDNDDPSFAGASDTRVMASACKADQYGWDYLLLGNTLWGYYFIDEAMLQGLAGPTGSVEEAHGYAAPLVTAMQPDSQPQLLDHDSGERIP